MSACTTYVQYNVAKCGYDELLVPSPKDWKFEPLDEYGVTIEDNCNAARLFIHRHSIPTGESGSKQHEGYYLAMPSAIIVLLLRVLI
jgi:hypothetical protein